MVELLKQPQFQPYPVAEQVVSIFAGTKGFLDKLAVSKVPAFEKALLKHFRDEFPEILEEIGATGAISDELSAKISEVMKNFTDRYEA
jgi:F-type H+-transporting ATPase subunit alpha